MLGPTLPELASHTHSQLSEISFLFTARSLGYLLGSLQAGRLFDRYAGHPILVVVLLGIAGAMAVIPIVSILWVLALVLLLLGVVESTVDVGGNTLLVWVHGRKVGPFMNGLHFFFGLGAFLAPVIVAQAVLWSGDIQWAYWSLAILILPIALSFLRLPSPPIRVAPSQGEAGHADLRLVSLISLFFFLYVGAEVSFGGWIYTYVTALNLTSEAVAAYLTSAFWGALTLGRLLSIPLATRFRPRQILLADLAGCLASLAILLLWAHSLLAVWVGSFGIGFSMASIFPTTLSLAENRMALTGRVTSWFFVGAGAGGMFLPWIIGQLFEPLGPPITIDIILFDILAACLVFGALLLFKQNPYPVSSEL